LTEKKPVARRDEMKIEFMSGSEMQSELIETMQTLMWLATKEISMPPKQIEELRVKADALIEKFQSDFVVY
jgi:hypothetical protein